MAPQTLLTPATKEVVADVVFGSAWVNRNPRQISRTGGDGRTPGNIHDYVSVKSALSPFLIIIVSTYPPYGLGASLNVENKWQPTYLALVGNTQKLDAIVDGKLTDDLYYASILCKVIGHKLSDSSRGDLHLCFWDELCG